MRFPTLATALVLVTPSVGAFFVQPAALLTSRYSSTAPTTSRMWAEESKDAVFMPPTSDEGDEEENDDDLLDKAELLGRGAAKVRFDQLFLKHTEFEFLPHSLPHSLFSNYYHSGQTRQTKRRYCQQQQ